MRINLNIILNICTYTDQRPTINEKEKEGEKEKIILNSKRKYQALIIISFY